MRLHIALLLVVVLYSLLSIATAVIVNVPDDAEDEIPSDIDNSDAELRLFYGGVAKKGCVPRGGNCDYSPNDCCPSTACRCNLWGANCRCQRKGVFQNWG